MKTTSMDENSVVGGDFSEPGGEVAHHRKFNHKALQQLLVASLIPHQITDLIAKHKTHADASSLLHNLAMSRSVENLNKVNDSHEAKNNGKKDLLVASSLTINSDSETARRRILFARYRGWSTLDEIVKSESVSDVPRIKKVSGYLKELVWYSSKDHESSPMLSYKTLAELISKNDLASLKSFLENRHCNLDDAEDDRGQTGLMLAAAQGKLDMVYLLLSHGANLAIEDNDGATALHHAAKNGHADVCLELLEAGANIEAVDSGGWTPFIWACYRGHIAAVDALVTRGADVNAKGLYNCTGLVWASGRGHYDVVELLLENNARVDSADKYGTTALIWAARAAHVDICTLLVRHGANCDAAGMYSWTPLLEATRRNKSEIVDEIVSKGPNINAVDKDGMTALAIACKEGYTDIALKLLNAGAKNHYQDKSKDTSLIHAARGGHRAIVEALIKKFADVDSRGKDGKTCLHAAIDRNNVEVVKLILTANPDLEIKTDDGDTALHRAVSVRNAELVELLLEKKAKISAVNKKNDTALHIAMRARSKAVVEVLLRDPKHSQQLYRPNNQGETPYNLDLGSGRPILGQMFGTRKINANQDGEMMLGYDLYSSALANILTDPSLSMPITVGLYAKWGSGKSFLLGKLRDEMKSFTKEWIVEPTLENSPLVFMVILHLACVIGIVSWILSYLAIDLGAHATIVAMAVAVGIVIITYSLLFGLITFSRNSHNATLYDLKVFLGNHFENLKLIVNVIFSHPPGLDTTGASDPYGQATIHPLRLLFTDQTKVITSSGGQNSVTQMIGSLFDAIEDHYGIFATRLYRAFKPRPLKATAMSKWRKMCCLPYAYLYVFVTLLSLLTVILLVVSLEHTMDTEDMLAENEDDEEDSNEDVTGIRSPLLNNSFALAKGIHHPGSESNLIQLSQGEKKILISCLVTMSTILGLILVANAQTFFRIIKSLIFSQRRHLQSAVAKLDMVKSEGYLQAVKGEVQLMVNMVRTLDAFTGYQTRLVVVVDGLDSCEQSRVLSVLDAVHMLFSDEGSPFIIMLAIDPHVITKAIELNIHQAFRETSIGGMAYLRNIVHLPFYLQNAGLRKVNVSQQLAGSSNRFKSSTWLELDSSERKLEAGDLDLPRKGKSSRQRRGSISSMSSIGSRFNLAAPNQSDMTKVVATDEYMSDVNLKSMRRLMNVVNVMARLMRAFHIDFNWNHLATWVHLSEQWPYRVSWIIFYVETAVENKHVIADSISLWDIYSKIRPSLPSHRDLEPLLDMDRDEKKLEAFLSMKSRTLTVKILKIFLPFAINLDPYVKKIIRDEYLSLAALEGNDTGLGWFSNSRKSDSKLVTKAHHSAPVQSYKSAAKKKNIDRIPQSISHQQPSSDEPSDVHQSDPGQISPIHLPPALTSKNLSKKSVEEICDLLRKIEWLSIARVEAYCDIIVAQNINGAVLARCKLNELKSVLNMSFGDWEMFQLVILSLRESERHHKSMVALEAPGSNINEDLRWRQPTEVKAVVSAAESAITMEDALISGLLSKLNEEAQEDIISDELLERRKPSEDGSIYIKRSHGGGIMTQSIGSEDAFNALEKGYRTSLRSINGLETMVLEKSSNVLDLDSRPSSPSKVTQADQPISNRSSRPCSSMRVKTKHIRDRLDPMKNTKAEDDPYAWISYTAPSSPMTRSRAASINFEEPSSALNLGEKVRRTIKHALNKIDQPQPNALPPVHRAREPSHDEGSSGFRFASKLRSSDNSRQNSISSASMELPKFGSSNNIDDSVDDEEEDLGSSKDISSSPEQATVMPKDTSRPHIQDIFPSNQGSSKD